ncbi:hypothetical protein SAMN05421505_1446 [Sinosporangium album]|uniref:Major Facilitator Superfamily protein n=1 Tax=Sinosporangium album TaxID=504805 RepID=A0A1G8JLK5_9ACTN|nr:hypothetical protein [Sinosporangium album]SDI32164.1 hypothetical protein SAMN05421505_1446 [Sinosporangium album]
MAVPPIERRQAVAVSAVGPSRVLPSSVSNVVLVLLIALALPLAIVTVPNTASFVSALLPPGVERVALLRAHGLALPVMAVTVPLVAALMRAVSPAPIMVVGLALMALADAAGGFADSTLLVGLVRGLHGLGAGLLVPASLVAAWGCAGYVKVVWVAALSTGLVSAQALALWPIDAVTSWRVTLQPYPLVTGVALALAAVHLILWLRSPRRAATDQADDEAGPATEAVTEAATAETAKSGRPLVAVLPALAVGGLAVGTTYGWSANLVLVTAGLSLVAFLVLASLADRRQAAFLMVAVGAVILPTTAQVTSVELRGLGGPGLSGLWMSFAVAVAAAVVAAVVAIRLTADRAPALVWSGLLLLVAGLVSVRVMVPAEDGLPMTVPLTLVAAGAALALMASLRVVGLQSALWALSLCFPSLLAGYMLGTGIQLAHLRDVVSTQGIVDALVGAVHLWALVAGFLVIAVVILGASLSRRSASGAPFAGEAGTPAVPDGMLPAPVAASQTAPQTASQTAPPAVRHEPAQAPLNPLPGAGGAWSPATGGAERDGLVGNSPARHGIPSDRLVNRDLATAAPLEASARRAGERSGQDILVAGGPSAAFEALNGQGHEQGHRQGHRRGRPATDSTERLTERDILFASGGPGSAGVAGAGGGAVPPGAVLPGAAPAGPTLPGGVPGSSAGTGQPGLSAEKEGGPGQGR